jgi:hypothetical protein
MRPAQGRPDVYDACVDYLVDTRTEPVGVLAEWLREDDGTPHAFVVEQGWFGRRRRTIPVAEIVAIDHEAGRILVTAAAAPPDRPGLLGKIGALLGRRLRLAEVPPRALTDTRSDDPIEEADMRKQTEGDNTQRRRQAHEAREQGRSPSEVQATTSASKQRAHAKQGEEHDVSVARPREGKQDSAE